MRSTIAAIASLIVFASLVVACSGESRMTVAEYARWCSDTRDSLTASAWDSEASGTTWGQFEDYLQFEADKYHRIENQIPDEISLLIYHHARRGLLEEYIYFTRQQYKDGRVSVFALLGAGRVANASIEAAKALLLPRTRAALVSTGCFDD